MANYTFSCKTCGEFTLWLRPHGNKQEIACPDCLRTSKRIFKPPMTSRMDTNVTKRIERGMEPRLVKSENMPKPAVKKPAAPRPWQAGH